MKNVFSKLLIFIDALFIYSSLYFSNELIYGVNEPTWKLFIIVASYLTFMYAFNIYEAKINELNKLSAIYIILLAITFSVFLNFVFYFETVGRKVYLFHSFIMYLYLWARIKLANNLIYQKQMRIYLFGEDENGDIAGKKIHDYDRLKELIESGGIKKDEIIILGDNLNIGKSEFVELMRSKASGYRIVNIVEFYEKILFKIPVKIIDDYKYFFDISRLDYPATLNFLLKRMLDVVISLLLIISLLPIMIVVGILIKIDSRGSIFFSQKRTGFNNKEFFIYKYRTMKVDAERNGAKWAAKDDSRITRVGKLIRKIRFDELPQLFNVLKNDMSFVGPRPERPEFDQILEKQIPYYRLRYLVKPGLTGWAQINYEYGDSTEDARQKLMYDLYYIKKFSVLLDLEVIMKTVGVVVSGKGR